MTKPNFTSISVIIDESGSMQPIASDTVGGFNKFLIDQKAEPGDAIFSLVTFSDRAHVLADCIPLADAKNLSLLEDTTKSTLRYTPGGCTALLDAVGSTIDSVGRKLAALKEEDRPSKVLFLIMTDGQENASREYTFSKVKEMIEHQKSKYAWDFIFMGAGIDAAAGGAQIGITRDCTFSFNHDSASTQATYGAISRGVSNYRSSTSKANDVVSIISGTPEENK